MWHFKVDFLPGPPSTLCLQLSDCLSPWMLCFPLLAALFSWNFTIFYSAPPSHLHIKQFSFFKIVFIYTSGDELKPPLRLESDSLSSLPPLTIWYGKTASACCGIQSLQWEKLNLASRLSCIMPQQEEQQASNSYSDKTTPLTGSTRTFCCSYKQALCKSHVV